MGRFFQTISGAQWITMVLVPVLVVLINTFLPPGPIHDAVMGLVLALGGQSLVSNRVPSTQGGTVTPAAIIEPGSTIVEASTTPPNVKKGK